MNDIPQCAKTTQSYITLYDSFGVDPEYLTLADFSLFVVNCTGAFAIPSLPSGRYSIFIYIYIYIFSVRSLFETETFNFSTQWYSFNMFNIRRILDQTVNS